MARPPHLYNKVVGTRVGNIRDNEPALEIVGDVVLARTGAGRARGFNAARRRLELYWLAGATGLPQLSAVTQAPATDTYSTAALLANLKADHFFEILGTNAVSGDVAYSAEGGLTFTTHGASGDQVILVPHLTSGQSPWTGWTWGTDQETTWECEVYSGSSVANSVIYWAGMKLTNTSVQATDDDQVFFRVVGGANWQCMYSVGGTDFSVDSGVALAASTSYHLKVVINAGRVPTFYINGSQVAVGAALTDATDLKPYIGIQAGSAATKFMVVRQQAISRNFA